jgi:predicted GH43/DUF377 family glycosyl hydrolase
MKETLTLFTAAEMKTLLAQVRTPRKVGELVLAASYQPGSFDSHAVDCPFVFRRQGRFFMTFVGFDGIGYRTGLAVSDDLRNWCKEGLLLDRGPRGSVTEYNVALTWILRENDLCGSGELRRINGLYVGVYHAYPRAGYEAGPAVIGLCTSRDLRDWQLQEPCLFPAEGGEWERAGLYKACLLEHEGAFYLFYNAKNQERSWIERTGLATSPDLVHWTRYAGNPVLPVGEQGAFDDRFASDPCVLKVGDAWAMFYFGNCSDGHARDGVAFSRDLLHWQKSGELLIDVGKLGAIDSRHAHKPSLFSGLGRLWHFYCAVSPLAEGKVGDVVTRERRGIGVAWR